MKKKRAVKIVGLLTTAAYASGVILLVTGIFLSFNGLLPSFVVPR